MHLCNTPIIICFSSPLLSSNISVHCETYAQHSNLFSIAFISSYLATYAHQLGIQFIRDREIEADFDSDMDGQRVNKSDDYSASPGTKLRKRVEGSFPYKVGSSNGSKVSSPGGRVVTANVLSISSEKTCHSMVSLEAIGEGEQ